MFASGLAAMSVIGLAGRWNAWADVANQFAPIWLVVATFAFSIISLTRFWRYAPAASGLLVFSMVAQMALCGQDWIEGPDRNVSRAIVGKQRLFSVLTFNVWNESRDLDLVIRRVVSSGADVVTLQEALALERIPSKALMAAYPYRYTCEDWWGCELLILSKRPILDHHFAAPEPTGSGGPLWAVWVTTTAADGRPVRVLSTHLTWPIPPLHHQDQVDRLAEIMRGLGAGSLVVTCDCNASGASFALQKQDLRLEGVVRRTRSIFSWPAIIDGTHVPAPFPFLGIDQLYASADWRTIDLQRLPTSGSDHYPILVKLARD